MMTQQATIDRSQLGPAWEEINSRAEELYFEQLDAEYINSVQSGKQFEVNYGVLVKRIFFNEDNDTLNYVIDTIAVDDSRKVMVIYYQFGDNTREVLNMYGADPHKVAQRFPERALDGNLACVKVYFSQAGTTPHWHYVTFGLSDLYNTEVAPDQNEVPSGCGFELTMRVLAMPDDLAPPVWPLSFLQSFADYVLKNQRGFRAGHFINTGAPIFAKTKTNLQGFGVAADPELKAVSTCSGDVDMLQLIGFSGAELTAAKGAGSAQPVVERMQIANPMLITDYARIEEFA